ncbi:MAG: putative membrane protein [Cyclobacteriaceae bacterium]|jgi:putative membrane protein
MRQYLNWFGKGVAMGAANVIPGVSGGTIAFVTGIYVRFIDALKSVDLKAIQLLFRFKIKDLLVKIDAGFLFTILGGVAVSILSLAKLLEIALTSYESFTFAFFFGLIVASIIGVGKQVGHWNLVTIASLTVGILIAGTIAFLPPAPSNDAFYYVFLCGVVAVCSMILPGLSGSYVLLLMGNYLLVLQAISSVTISVLLPLALGCLVGLAMFSRLLSYLFAHFKDVTIALLTGFVVGSLLIIWPWKITEYEQIAVDKVKAVGYEWIWPSLGQSFLIEMALLIVGFLLVWWLEKSAAEKPAD